MIAYTFMKITNASYETEMQRWRIAYTAVDSKYHKHALLTVPGIFHYQQGKQQSLRLYSQGWSKIFTFSTFYLTTLNLKIDSERINFQPFSQRKITLFEGKFKFWGIFTGRAWDKMTNFIKCALKFGFNEVNYSI